MKEDERARGYKRDLSDVQAFPDLEYRIRVAMILGYGLAP